MPSPKRAGQWDASSAEVVALLVVRVWREPGHRDEFRARVTTVVDIRSGAEDVQATDDPDRVLALVRRWLDRASARIPKEPDR
jgi:hypothetical protein